MIYMKPFNYLVFSTVCTALLMCGVFVHAEWQDPIDSPAIPSSLAHTDLLLDIESVVSEQGLKFIAVGAHGNIVFSEDEGLTWQQAQVPVQSTLTSLDMLNSSIGWTVGHDGIVLKTADGGFSWQRQLDGIQANIAIVESAEESVSRAQLKLDQAEEANDLDLQDEAALVLDNAMFALEDAQFDSEQGVTRSFMDVAFLDNRHGYVVGSYGVIFETRDGGDSWQEVSGRVSNPERFHWNRIIPLSNKELVLLGESGLISLSVDQGETWQMLESPYDGSLFHLQKDTSGYLLSGLRGHVFHSDSLQSGWDVVELETEQTLISGAYFQNQSWLVGNSGAIVRSELLQAIESDSSSSLSVDVPSVDFLSGYTFELESRVGITGIAPMGDDQGVILVGESGVIRLDSEGHRLTDVIRTNSWKEGKSHD